MNDRRSSPMNDRVVLASMASDASGRTPVNGVEMQVGVPVANLLRVPDGARDRQVLYGDTLTVLEDRDGWSFVQAQKDGYVGYVRSGELRAKQPLTHRVHAPSSHLYLEPDMKTPDRMALSFGSRVSVLAEHEKFWETQDGFIAKVHCTPVEVFETDPVAVAHRFLGTPYLWGGNSRFGIDCSGLVQAGLLACGIPCPGDSGDQERTLGEALPAATEPKRGDLLFWKGHVALVRDPDSIIHANVYHMAVAIEPLDAAIKRIAAQGDGPVTAHKRLG
jgi:cell wall-associated NlpC family hydrolase